MRKAITRCNLRIFFTILMYGGIVVFLLPYLFGKTSTGSLFLILGGALAVLSGMLRCYFMEGDSGEQHIDSKPCP